MSIFRGLLFNLYFLFLTLIMGLGALPIRALGRKDLALSYAKLWSRAVLFGFSHLCSVRIAITGQENIPSGPCLIASQHQSFFDGFVWMNLVPLPTYIIKQELTRIPLVGPMLILAGMIPVKRSDGSKALRTMMKDSADAHAANRQIIIFPEGTRTLPGERQSIQPGIIALARQASVPVVPVATNSGLFWDRSPWHKRPGILKVAIGKPLPTTQGRGAFTGVLENAWDELCATHALPRDPVDNSVE
ncbi:MAG: lysophospholipid acyltransferase family protein [Gluconobacter japonicus]|uniref:lysophospholipid acyltransferase family protein n=1 Tax=Gluconobacter japonicus TaxID=376620 RepID=UPI0039EBF080